TVTFRVTDKDGGVGSDTVVVTVNNVAPTANAGPDQTVNEGSTVNLAGTFSDPGTVDTFTFNWHVVSSTGQRVPDGRGQNLSFPTQRSGDLTVTFRVTDKDGGVGTDTVVVTVRNVAPTANAGADQTANVDSLVTLNGSYTDPGSADTLQFTWHVVSSN